MSDNIIYAKCRKDKNGTFITETLQEHTENLLKKLEELKTIYENEINYIDKSIWNKLKLACLFHDLGKLSNHFQAKIKKVAGLPYQKPSGEEIPHNYLSPAFFTLLDLETINDVDPLFYSKLFYTVIFHHNRKIKFDESYLKKIIKTDLSQKVKHLKWIEKYNIQIKNDLTDDYCLELDDNYQDYQDIRHLTDFVLMKGLFHRIDHCASGHISIEEEKIQEPHEKLLNYLSQKHNNSNKENILKPFQKNAEKYREKNIVLQASTGLGKTEFSLNWINESKAFYILPLKVSVNAIYERFCSIFCPVEKDKIGLLHGDSMLYGIVENEGEGDEKIEEKLSIEEHTKRIEVSRQLSMPLTVSTADQLFTSVFKWKGYEKIYATLMYSKIVIDEPQSYSPQMLAMIIKCLKEVSDLGGKFCLMSATIHPKIKEILSEIAEFLPPQFNQELKHKIKIIDNSIDYIKEIISENHEVYLKENKKILIICNTVKKSQDIYESLKSYGNVHLLHSCFIQSDRRKKERNYSDKDILDKSNSIMQDCEKNEFVIWISTQIVEASLDIDYDILFTEIASIDALIQRMGRVYRKNNVGRVVSDNESPNVIIFTKNQSDKNFIYDKDICLKTIEVLKEKDNFIISEEDKQILMEKVYQSKNAENFNNEFDKVYKLLELGFEEHDKTKAQKLFREVFNTTVIPECIYEENEHLIEEAINILRHSRDKFERLRAIKTINDFSINIPSYKSKGSTILQLPIEKKYYKNDVFIIRAKYDSEIGLIFDKDLDSISVFI